MTGGRPVAVWQENDVELVGQRTVGYRVGSRVAVDGEGGEAN